MTVLCYSLILSDLFIALVSLLVTMLPGCSPGCGRWRGGGCQQALRGAVVRAEPVHLIGYHPGLLYCLRILRLASCEVMHSVFRII